MKEARPDGLKFSCFFARVVCLWEQFQLPPSPSNFVEKKRNNSVSWFFLLFSLDMEWAVAHSAFRYTGIRPEYKLTHV